MEADYFKLGAANFDCFFAVIRGLPPGIPVYVQGNNPLAEKAIALIEA
jgi:hypothetical protein